MQYYNNYTVTFISTSLLKIKRMGRLKGMPNIQLVRGSDTNEGQGDWNNLVATELCLEILISSFYSDGSEGYISCWESHRCKQQS